MSTIARYISKQVINTRVSLSCLLTYHPTRLLTSASLRSPISSSLTLHGRRHPRRRASAWLAATLRAGAPYAHETAVTDVRTRTAARGAWDTAGCDHTSGSVGLPVADACRYTPMVLLARGQARGAVLNERGGGLCCVAAFERREGGWGRGAEIHRRHTFCVGQHLGGAPNSITANSDTNRMLARSNTWPKTGVGEPELCFAGKRIRVFQPYLGGVCLGIRTAISQTRGFVPMSARQSVHGMPVIL